MSAQTNKLRKHLQAQIKSSIHQTPEQPRSAQKKRQRKDESNSPPKKQKVSQGEPVVDIAPTSDVSAELSKKIASLEAEVQRLREEIHVKDAQIANLSQKKKTEERVEASALEEKRKYHEAMVEANQIKKKEKLLAQELESVKQAAHTEVENYKNALKALEEKAAAYEKQLKGSQAQVFENEDGVEAQNLQVEEKLEDCMEECKEVPLTEETSQLDCSQTKTDSPPQLGTPDKRNLRESEVCDFTVLSSKKSDYARALEQQIQELEERKKREKKMDQAMNYFPFGKPGGGAPLVERGEVRANVTFIRSAAISPSPLKVSQ